MMDTKVATVAKKPSVVFDLRMPGFHYRDDRGQAKTVGAERPQHEAIKMDCLANLTA